MSSLPSASGPLKARLLCRVRAGGTLTFSIRGDEAVIGREPGMAVAVPMEGVSRQHARIVFDGKSHWIEDLKSTNGTFLKVRGTARLEDGDQVLCGSKLLLVRGR